MFHSDLVLVLQFQFVKVTALIGFVVFKHEQNWTWRSKRFSFIGQVFNNGCRELSNQGLVVKCLPVFSQEMLQTCHIPCITTRPSTVPITMLVNICPVESKSGPIGRAVAMIMKLICPSVNLKPYPLMNFPINYWQALVQGEDIVRVWRKNVVSIRNKMLLRSILH